MSKENEAKSDVLLSCPFCGGIPTVNRYNGWYYVSCNSCHAKTDNFGVPEGAITIWNRRQSQYEQEIAESGKERQNV